MQNDITPDINIDMKVANTNVKYFLFSFFTTNTINYFLDYVYIIQKGNSSRGLLGIEGIDQTRKKGHKGPLNYNFEGP